MHLQSENCFSSVSSAQNIEIRHIRCTARDVVISGSTVLLIEVGGYYPDVWPNSFPSCEINCLLSCRVLYVNRSDRLSTLFALGKTYRSEVLSSFKFQSSKRKVKRSSQVTPLSSLLSRRRPAQNRSQRIRLRRTHQYELDYCSRISLNINHLLGYQPI